MTETAPRLTVVTPDGEYATDDPRAAEAIATYVRSEVAKDLGRTQIDQINAALAVVPQEGVCLACVRRRPLFLLDCQHWEVFGFSHSHHLWLCARCSSRAAELFDDRGENICGEIAWEPYDGWGPFTGPTPGTAEFRAADLASRTVRVVGGEQGA